MSVAVKTEREKIIREINMYRKQIELIRINEEALAFVENSFHLGFMSEDEYLKISKDFKESLSVSAESVEKKITKLEKKLKEIDDDENEDENV